jgi:hypothetical protein
MAGNTKLRGLGADNTIELERWGVRVKVPLDGQSMRSLRKALYEELPVKPSPKERKEEISYDAITGKIQMTLDPEAAQFLCELVAEESSYWTSCPTKREGDERRKEHAEFWTKGLNAALAAHEAYTDTEGEPGVDPSVDGTKQT